MHNISLSESIPWHPRGFVEIEYYKKGDTIGVDKPFMVENDEFAIENLVVNVFREMLPLLLAPKIITGRSDNSASTSSWLDRRICLVGFGIGDGAATPSTKPEEPEDGRTRLVGESDYPNSKQGLQGPIRRVPLNPSGPSEVHTSGSPINSYYLFKEVDANGVNITSYAGGGSEIVFTFTIEEDEYIGNIMEYVLLFGGGDSSDDSLYEIADPDYEKVRLSRELARPAARKTRRAGRPIEKTRDVKFRLNWRIRT